MCVIVAILLPRDPKTGKPEANATWTLAKMRDRPYKPTITLNRKKENGGDLSYFYDIDTHWAEGIYTEGNYKLALVNSALSNIDKYEILIQKKKLEAEKKLSSSQTEPKNITVKGNCILEALKTGDIESCVAYLANFPLSGHTFVTDGTRLFWLEIYVPISVTNELEELVRNENPLLTKAEVMNGARNLLNKNQYKVNVKELFDNEPFYVRTNHTMSDADNDSQMGIITKYTKMDKKVEIKNGGGYQTEGISKNSTIKRLVYTQVELQNIYSIDKLFESFKKLGDENIDPELYYRPIRHVSDTVPVFTTMQIIFDLKKAIMHIIPIENCLTIENPKYKNSHICIESPVKRQIPNRRKRAFKQIERFSKITTGSKTLLSLCFGFVSSIYHYLPRIKRVRIG